MKRRRRILIIEFFNTVNHLKPTLVGGYNSAFFDFPFILIRRAAILGLDIEKIAKTLNPEVKFTTETGYVEVGK